MFLVRSAKLFYFCKFQPFKVIGTNSDIGANRKRVCDFLLVRNSNLGPILHRLGDFAVFCPLFHPNFGGVRVAPDCPCWGQHAHKP